MKLARKFLLAMSAAAFLVLGVAAWFAARDEMLLFQDDVRHDHGLLADALVRVAQNAWKHGGAGTAASEVISAGSPALGVHTRLVSLAPGASGTEAPMDPGLARTAQPGGGVYAVTARDDRLVSYAALDGPASGWAVEIAESAADRGRLARSLVVRFAALTVALAVAFALVTMFLGGRIIGRPMKLLVAHARSVGRGELGHRTALAQRDELGELAAELDLMSERIAQATARAAAEGEKRLAALQQLRHADRLTTVGKLASGMAHELGTPLNVVHGRARLIEDDGGASPESRRSARIIVEQAERMTALIRRLLDFARRGAPKKESTDLAGIARRCIGLLQPLARKRGASLELTVVDDCCALVDPSAVEQVLTNLVMNALHASPGGGVVEMAVTATRTTPPPDVGGPEASYQRVLVGDHGAGIDPVHLEHIFEPFFTTKGVGEGTGLGLSVAWGIVRDHGGWIAVETAPGEGSRFSVYLPAEESA
ncbi:MAG: HAMP domain-containing sensor histidine kinase [Polyangiaceae bacterium]